MYGMSCTQVVVTCGGQVTIPAEMRKRLGNTEGTTLNVTSRNGEIIFRIVETIFDLAGTSKLTREEAFRLLDEVRSGE